MTVMIDRFFGVHPDVVRSGIWGRMKPGEKDLYIFLMADSERRCTRRLVVTDAEVSKTVHTAPRTLCNARKKLQERGLISFKVVVGNRYEYTICDPKTGKPYAGDPRDPIVVPKRTRSQKPAFPDVAATPVISHQYASPKTDDNDRLERHGVSGIFRKTVSACTADSPRGADLYEPHKNPPKNRQEECLKVEEPTNVNY